MTQKRVFLIWDSKIGSEPGAAAVGPLHNLIRFLIRRWKGRVEIVALGLPEEPGQGYILDNIRRELQRSDAAIAVLDLPNANVGLEIGMALGYGLPVALIAMHKAAGSWTTKAPIAGHVVQSDGFQKGTIDRLIEEVLDGRSKDWNQCARAPNPKLEPGDRTLLLWPSGTPGDDAFDIVEEIKVSPPLRHTPKAGKLSALYEALDGVGKVVWLAPVAVNEPRDGGENARLAIWVGYAMALGHKPLILREEPATGEGRALVDVHGERTPWATPDELAETLQRELGGAVKAEAEADPLETWRGWLRHRHDSLVPFGWALPTSELQVLHVPLDVHGREDRPEQRLQGTLDAVIRQLGPGARLVVQADPGGGKTTTARHLAWRLAERGSETTAVYVALAAWSTGSDPLAQADAELPQEGLAARLAALAQVPGRLWLLLDGFDEVSPARRRALIPAIHAWADAHPAVTVVVLGRTDALRDCFQKGWTRAEVRGLGPRLRSELLAKLVPDTVRREAIERHIRALPRLTEIADNPLMLTLIAVVGQDAQAAKRPLPTSRPALYAQAVEVLLEGRHREIPHPVRNQDIATDALSVIALVLHEKGGETWDGPTARRAVLDAWDRDPPTFKHVAQHWPREDGSPGTSAELLRDLSDNAGIFGVLDEDGQWKFRHRTLREYLVARALERLGDGEQEKFLAAWEAEKPSEQGEASRSGEVVALLTAMRGGPPERLRELGARNPNALVRLLTTTEGIDAAEVLSLMFSVEGWDIDQLVAALLAAAGTLEQVLEALWARVQVGASRKDLAILWVTLGIVAARGDRAVALRCPPGRERFFGQAGIALPDPARIVVEHVAPGTPYCTPVHGAERVVVVDLPGGSFRMGSPDGVGYDRERPVHTVEVDGFAIGQTPVTNRAFVSFPGVEREAVGAVADHPVVEMNWFDATLFAAWLGGRLPTEAEWEYACRAGTTTAWSFGDDEARLEDFAWFNKNANDVTQPVAARLPNPWGLHDVHGNVWEWCAGGKRAFDPQVQRNPFGPMVGDRVVRGGAFLNLPDGCRSACRGWYVPAGGWHGLGLRLVFPLPVH